MVMVRQLPMILLLLLVSISSKDFLSYYPYDIEPTATYKCLKQQGYDKISIWVQSDPKGIDPDASQNLLNANNAGLQVQIWFTPCRARSAASQAQLLLKSVGPLFKKLWVYPQSADGDCSWYEYPPEFNCMYLQQFLNELKKAGKTVGIEASRQYWIGSFEGALACEQVDMYELLWVPSGVEVDGKADFGSYRQIGGWRVPRAKVYSSRFACGVGVSLVYSP